MTLARPVVQPVLGEAPATGPSVQATPVTSPTTSPPVLGPTATAVVQRIDGSAPTPPTSAERSDGELDELARQLFGRFRSRLRDEYIYEREAKGLTFDHS